jgi:hypothetical protein
MPVKKLSVALEDKVAAAVAAAAERDGMSVSAWLNDAATEALAIEQGLAAVAEFEAESGPFTEEEMAAAAHVMERAAKPSRQKWRIV